MPVATETFLNIKPCYLVSYNQPVEYCKRSERQLKNEFNLKNNNNKGIISVKANKRLKTAIDWLIALSSNKKVYQKSKKRLFNYKLGFITLTLSNKQIHSDLVIKQKLLNQFLIEAKKKWNVNNYIWRAESQKNGNIHFHILIDVFIPYWEVRNTWNRIQDKLGYVSRFQQKNNASIPNSTDIHSVYKIKNLHKYFAKYMTKNNDNRVIIGKLWGLSVNLSRMDVIKLYVNEKINDELNNIYRKFHYLVKKENYFSLFNIDYNKWKFCNCPTLVEFYNNYLIKFKNLIDSDHNLCLEL